MPTEIERKFLVRSDEWRAVEGLRICQGYLNRDKHCTVRIRIAGVKAFITVKGLREGIARLEYEYEIPLDHAEEMLALCQGPLIDKVRRVIQYRGFNWEVDEFHGDNEGLVVAEIELASPDQRFDTPPWIGEEVSDDPRYYNSNLTQNPYKNWPEAKRA